MDNLFIKYFQGELTDIEKQELFSGIEENLESRDDFSKLNNIWGISQLLTQRQDKQVAYEGKKRLSGRIKKEHTGIRRVVFIRYAALICLVFAAGCYLTMSYYEAKNKIVYTEIHVPQGQRLHITLADGSSVWLSPQSRMKLPNEFKRNSRTVELDGEGFFEVVKDEKRPFIVKSKGYNVEVTGTKFNLFSYSKNPRYEAHLVEGKIQVYSNTDKNDALLLFPNEKAALVNNRLMKFDSEYDNKEYIATGIYNFNATRFIDILEYLAIWYDVRFEVKGPVSLTTRVNAKFRLNDELEDILTALQNTFWFNFKRLENNKIEISK